MNGSGSAAAETGKSRGNRENHGRNRSPNHYRRVLDLTELRRREFRQVAKSLTRRAHDLHGTQRRRSGTAGGGLTAPITAPRPTETPEFRYDAVEFLCDALDSLNPWHEPDSFHDDFHVPEQTEDFLHLEL